MKVSAAICSATAWAATDLGVDQAHQIGGGAEHRAFERHRQADRQAELPDVAEARPVRPPEAAEQVEAAELAVGQR